MKTIFQNRIASKLIVAILCAIGFTKTTHCVIYKAELWQKDNTIACLLSDAHLEPMNLVKEPYSSTELEDIRELIGTCCDLIPEKQVVLISEDPTTYFEDNKLHPESEHIGRCSTMTQIIPYCRQNFPGIRATSSEQRNFNALNNMQDYFNSYSEHAQLVKELSATPESERAKIISTQSSVVNCEQTLCKAMEKISTIGTLISEIEACCQECCVPTGNAYLDNYLFRIRNQLEQELLEPLREASPDGTKNLCTIIAERARSSEELINIFRLSLHELVINIPYIEMNSLRAIDKAHAEGRSLVFAIMGGEHANNISPELAAMGYTKLPVTAENVELSHLANRMIATSPSTFSGKLFDQDNPLPTDSDFAAYLTVLCEIIDTENQILQAIEKGSLFSTLTQALETKLRSMPAANIHDLPEPITTFCLPQALTSMLWQKCADISHRITGSK